MKKLVLIMIIVVFSQSVYGQWYTGGTLHKATVSQWNNATYKNKLATAGDWLAATTWKGHLNSANDFKKLKIQAARLVMSVDDTVYDLDIGTWKVNEIAVMLVTLSNDLSP